MTAFVLVHGAWHGGWCWRRVADRLRQQGHDVYTPTLTGLGDRRHLANPEIDLEMHVADVIGVLDAEELRDSVICGHSYGGMVITPVLDRRPASFRAAMWLDAFVPADGQCVMDLQPPERAKNLREKIRTEGEGWWIPPMTPEYFGVMNEQDAAWIRRRCVPQPYRTFTQPVRLDGAWQSVARKMYVMADLHPNSNFGRVASSLSAEPDWEVRTVPSGHEVMVDTPDLLVELLLDLV